MVDAEHAILGEGVADLRVDFARRGEVVADRLFHRDAAFGAGDVRGPQALRNRAEHRRRGREVNADRAAQTVAEQRRELVITGARTRIDRAIVDAFEEAFDTGFVRSEEHTSELQSLMRISYAVF